VEDFEQYRVALTGYCYRMLGAALEAEDAVQETFVRAWSKRSTFDPARGSYRAWLYAIATNVCLDLLRGARRRAVVMDLGSPVAPGTPLGVPLPDDAWVQPMPDSRIVDPADVLVGRESVQLAFVAALQHLPPKQRAILILRDVLSWSAGEVASLLSASLASVNSALQRARATLASRPSAGPVTVLDEEHQALMRRYVQAFRSYDIEALVSLLHEDATMTMPPFAWSLRGRAAIHQTLLAAGSEAHCRTTVLVPAGLANGEPAYAQYGPSGPFALVTFTTAGGQVTGETVHLNGTGLFSLFGLPSVLTDELRAAASY
jgi:RNA polymerase sigma-70 factor, ECF subfamily